MMTPKPMEVVNAQTLMMAYFGNGSHNVLVHTYAEWQARLAGRDYFTWPRYSMPREPRPHISLMSFLSGAS